MADSLTRRSLARLTALAAVGGSVLLGWLLDAFEVEVDRDGGEGPPDEAGATRGDGPVGLPRSGTVEGDKRVSEAIADRRSRREFGDDPLTPAELGQLLWAAQGITERRPAAGDYRAAPSAGATYPLELFAVVGTSGVEGFEPGVYHYDPDRHELELVEPGDVQADLRRIAVDQAWVGAAAVDVVVTGVDERTTQRYGNRGRLRYVPMEAGHAGENIYLQAESLGLATVAVGAFRDDALRDLLGVDDAHRPLYIYPVGRRA